MTTPAPSAIEGDPAAIRDAAGRIRNIGARVDDATRAVERGATAAGQGWAGAAQQAFMTATADTGVRVGAMRQYVTAADVLETYAAALEDIQQRHAQAAARFAAAGQSLGGPLGRGDLTGGPGTLLAPAADVVAQHAEQEAARDAAAREMESLVNDALAANERASRAIELIAGPARDPGQGLSDVNKVTDTVAGVAGTTVQGLDDLAAAGAGAGATGLSDAAQVAKVGGVVGAAGFGAFDQLNQDASNPYYSNAERAGRAGAQVLTVGGTAFAAGAAGAAAGSLILPGVGTVIGGVVGAVGGYYLAESVDDDNDNAVDRGGELADSLGERAKDLSPW